MCRVDFFFSKFKSLDDFDWTYMYERVDEGKNLHKPKL